MSLSTQISIIHTLESIIVEAKLSVREERLHGTTDAYKAKAAKLAGYEKELQVALDGLFDEETLRCNQMLRHGDRLNVRCENLAIVENDFGSQALIAYTVGHPSGKMEYASHMGSHYFDDDVEARLGKMSDLELLEMIEEHSGRPEVSQAIAQHRDGAGQVRIPQHHFQDHRASKNDHNEYRVEDLLSAPNFNDYLNDHRSHVGNILNDLAGAFNKTGDADFVMTFGLMRGVGGRIIGLRIEGRRKDVGSRRAMAVFEFHTNYPTIAVLACICAEAKTFCPLPGVENRLKQVLRPLQLAALREKQADELSADLGLFATATTPLSEYQPKRV